MLFAVEAPAGGVEKSSRLDHSGAVGARSIRGKRTGSRARAYDGTAMRLEPARLWAGAAAASAACAACWAPWPNTIGCPTSRTAAHPIRSVAPSRLLSMVRRGVGMHQQLSFETVDMTAS
jgi:hypothetical protein